MHKVEFIGRLASDPKSAEKHSFVANFRVLCKNPKDDQPIGFNVAVWGKLGQACAEHLSAGRQVYVEGFLRFNPQSGNPRTYPRADQTTGSAFEVDAYRVDFLDEKGSADAHL
jgi:single-stranded DNA-binding protein